MINLDENSETYLPQPYIPSTPAYLGLDNCYKPEILEPDMDLSKRTLLCHDGSYESLMGDYRDNARLELEKQIYDSINSNFRDGLPILIKQKFYIVWISYSIYTNSILLVIFLKYFLFKEGSFLQNNLFVWFGVALSCPIV